MMIMERIDVNHMSYWRWGLRLKSCGGRGWGIWFQKFCRAVIKSSKKTFYCISCLVLILIIIILWKYRIKDLELSHQKLLPCRNLLKNKKQNPILVAIEFICFINFDIDQSKHIGFVRHYIVFYWEINWQHFTCRM